MNAPLELNERELLALAERCEAATGVDLEIDARIRALLGGFDFEAMRDGGHAVGDWNAPRYTASLDVAMTLVPEGCGWVVFYSFGEAQVGDQRVKAATPALALTSACLRAIAAKGEGR